MPEPITTAIVVSAGLQAGLSILGGNAKKKALEAQKRNAIAIAKENIKIVDETLVDNLDRLSEDSRRVLGTQSAQMAKAGVGIGSQTRLEVIGETANSFGRDIENMIKQAERQKKQIINDAVARAESADLQKQAVNYEVAGSLINIGGQAASRAGLFK